MSFPYNYNVVYTILDFQLRKPCARFDHINRIIILSAMRMHSTKHLASSCSNFSIFLSISLNYSRFFFFFLMEIEKKMELVLNNGRYDKKMRFNVNGGICSLWRHT